METMQTDVLVIGSGFGAAAVALRLSEAGHEVLIAEKGPHLEPTSDFRQTQDPKYLKKYLKGESGEGISTTYAEALGGGSGFYEMVSLRAPTLAFEQRDARGRRLWPHGLDRQALDPYYDRAEEMLHVEQIAPERVPKTGLVFSLLMKNLGYSCDRARYAVRGCQGSGFCVTGCIYGAKQSLLMNYLPQAQAAGATIMTGMEAVSIQPLGDPPPVRCRVPLRQIAPRYEVKFVKREDGSTCRVRARIVVLGGGTIGSAKLLIQSRPKLPLLSKQLGHGISFNGSVKIAGLLPDDFPDADMFTGQSHPGMISYHFLESHGITIAAAKPLPIQVVASARLTLAENGPDATYWGAPNVDLMKLYRKRFMVLYALGLTPSNATYSRGENSNDGPKLNLDVTPELEAYYKRTRQVLEDVLVKNGGRVLEEKFLDGSGSPRKEPFFSTAHHTGSCRMADSKRDGVVRASGEVFDYPGLYVSDGACIPTSLAVNTSLTILANAERIADGIVDLYAS